MKTAIRWGPSRHRHHGPRRGPVLPGCLARRQGKIKILYGVEGYFVNNLDDRMVVHGKGTALWTGVRVLRHRDHRPEGGPGGHHGDRRRGAAKRRGLRAVPDLCEPQPPPDAGDHRPHRHHRRHAQGRAPAEGGPDGLLDFVDGRPLAAHNAEFDIGFIRAGCKRWATSTPPMWTPLILAQNLLPELHKYKLDIVAEAPGPARVQPPPGQRRCGHGGLYADPLLEDAPGEGASTTLQAVNKGDGKAPAPGQQDQPLPQAHHPAWPRTRWASRTSTS